MRTNNFYVISPKPRLCSTTNSGQNDVLDLIKERQLWSKTVSDRTPYSRKDYEDEVKLLFLANLLLEVASEHDFKKQLGAFEISVPFFGQWWSLETYLIDEFVEEVETRISNSKLTEAVAEQSPVFSAIRDHIAAK